MRGRLLLGILCAARVGSLRGEDCAPRARLTADASAVRAVVVAGEEDPAVAAGVAALGADMMATLTPPNLSTAMAAASAGLLYLPSISARDVDRLLYDTAFLASIRAIPAISGFQYFDHEVTEGYAAPSTQGRAYGILKALFPDRLALYATRLDPIATDPAYLEAYFRPEFTDLVTPYFYPVGTTVLGTQEETDPWEDRLRSLLSPVAARMPAGKPVLPVVQAFQQIGHPVSGGLPKRQLRVYSELWPENENVAVFWWGGPTDEPFSGISDLPRLARGVRQLFGQAPSRPAPCLAAPREPSRPQP